MTSQPHRRLTGAWKSAAWIVVGCGAIFGVVLIARAISFNPDLVPDPSADAPGDELREAGDTSVVFMAQKQADLPLTYSVLHASDAGIQSDFKGFGLDYAQDDDLSIFCFRGNHLRNGPSRGQLDARPRGIVREWEFFTAVDTTTTKYGTWGGGAGWTGQPAVVMWNAEQKERLGCTSPDFVNADSALEVIVGSLCGNIYFLDANQGKPTRPHMSIGNPIKGSISVDPRKNGLLYVGQGVPHGQRFGAYVLDMFSRKEVGFINGVDSESYRKWGAFDSNPLVDAHSGQVVWPAENGLIYRMFTGSNGVQMDARKLKYTSDFTFRHGIESSLAAIGTNGFFVDNSGVVVCLDLKSLEPVWAAPNGDDSDATIALDQEKDGKFFLYTGCQVDKTAPVHAARFRKLDAATGQEIWSFERQCWGTEIGGKTNSGGILSSPALGKRRGEHLVYCIFARTNERQGGEFVALNKHTGEPVYTVKMDAYSWASPVDVYDAAGNIYVFFTDVTGNIYIVDGLTGEVLVKEKTNYTFESSPVIVDDMVFLPARGRSILKYRIRA